ncbi:hypothetical protein [Microvirga brassicacearum]|uniref:Uncharacterized protein n=1 Tax=Microvirga brassicacearum TaxID=2580413 RepID=A0A5N3P7P8_9HYPH|nr:hypothetical protein [Microvirga brassicacearum]KAB0265750.1 hypothetical protein FEZ63_17210 [Microvirga brassicacearum]
MQVQPNPIQSTPGSIFPYAAPNEVQIGQLVFVAAVLATGWLFRHALALRLEPGLVQRAVIRLDATAAYAIGTVAAFGLVRSITMPTAAAVKRP